MFQEYSPKNLPSHIFRENPSTSLKLFCAARSQQWLWQYQSSVRSVLFFHVFPLHIEDVDKIHTLQIIRLLASSASKRKLSN